MNAINLKDLLRYLQDCNIQHGHLNKEIFHKNVFQILL